MYKQGARQNTCRIMNIACVLVLSPSVHLSFSHKSICPLRVCPWYSLGRWSARGHPFTDCPPEKFHLTSELPKSQQNRPGLNFTQKKQKTKHNARNSAPLENACCTTSRAHPPILRPHGGLCSGLSVTIGDLGKLAQGMTNCWPEHANFRAWKAMFAALVPF